MEIEYVTNNRDISVGSYRIWVDNASSLINDHTHHNSVIVNQPTSKSNVIILSKNSINQLNQIRNKYPNKIIGIINPVGYIKYNCDFIIVGSMGEKDSLAINDNVFIYPLIESLFHEEDPKIHTAVEKITLGIHGSSTHNSKMKPSLVKALLEISSEDIMEFKLLLINNDLDGINIPGVEVETLLWNINTIKRDISRFDIGLVLGSSSQGRSSNHELCSDNKNGLHDTDYLIRFKNKSNPGRIFALHQLGIPVIADMTPSHFNMLGGPKSLGFIASSKHGWKKSIYALKEPVVRNQISYSAYAEFNKRYSLIDIIDSFMLFLSGIIN